MSFNFKPFGDAVAKQFTEMSKGELYRVNVTGDELWELYLASFPEGTNPMFRARTEHDGSYDRSVVRRLGNVVAIIEGKLVSMWDAPGLEYPYKEVARALSEKVKAGKIDSLFRTKESSYGYEVTTEKLEDGSIIRWNHFHAKAASRHQSAEVDKVLGDAATIVGVMERGLREITHAALDEITDLIVSNGLYRGEEHKGAVTKFSALHRAFHALSPDTQNQFLWHNWSDSSARFKNTVIGTLAADISEGMDVERAVASFEAKVAPTNYKRPTALMTPGMVAQAMDTITKLDLEPALARRYAQLADVSVGDVLWVSNTAKSHLKGGVADLLNSALVQDLGDGAHAEPITIDQFLSEVAPQASSMEVFVKGGLQKNLTSLTAPQHPNVTPLFKWGNDFAWSYNGEITDAIKERVEKAGGNVKADLRVSLAWFNFDDLDLHAECPYGHIGYQNKAGILDVDMNAGSGKTREAVENLAFMYPKDGAYRIYVNQFCTREMKDVGFTLEVECRGVVKRFFYNRAVPHKGNINVVTIYMKDGNIQSMNVSESIEEKAISQSVWGIETEKFVPVSTITHSPNYWEGNSVGNRHTFFFLEGCVNPDPTRGIYNEFLRSDLEPHRKVFEVLGSKTKCPFTPDQLSGLGFSSTVRESVVVRVTGPSRNKLYQISF